MSICPFCARLEDDETILLRGRSSAAFPDGFPLSDGHLLVIPHRHVARLETLSRDEWTDLFGLVRDAAQQMASRDDVSGLNIGVNSGAAAGQTVEHAHVHVIPRRVGDVSDPRGGVRCVLPARTAYWSER